MVNFGAKIIMITLKLVDGVVGVVGVWVMDKSTLDPTPHPTLAKPSTPAQNVLKKFR